jgi:hypothetical protein
MHRFLPLILLALAAGEAHAEGLALRRVMLSTGGVGYFEYDAEVTGDATLPLEIPRGQVDDVLASLVVFDDAGRIGGAELPGEDGGRAAFADVPFGPEALTSALAYLNALQGVRLEVRGPRPMSGLLLHAQTVHESSPPPAAPETGITRTRVTLLTDTGLQQFVLEDAESVQVADPALRARVDRALAALRGQAQHEARHLTLHIAGSGERMVHVGYVAGAPLWKTAYRVVLPAEAGKPARLQAWAVLENQSGNDWNGVELSLQYGNPISFRQALYRAYYVERPEVPVEILGRILPPGGAHGPQRAMSMARAFAAPAPAPAAAPKAAEAPGLAEPAEAPATTEAVEATTFHLPLPVSLPAGHSATLPILDREVPAARIGLVQEGRAHPLESLRIVNATGSSLPAGMLTLYAAAPETGFVGNALLKGLPPGESRVLSFAEDLHTRIDWRNDESTAVIGVSAAQGVLHVVRRQRHTARITLTAPADASRALLIEIPRPSAATLTLEGGLAPSEETASAWRVPVDLKPGETRTVVAHVDQRVEEATGLLQDENVLLRVLGTQALDPAARAALQHIADLRAALAARQADAARLHSERESLEHDEERLRQNLAAVPANDALHGRLVRALEVDETRLTALADQITAAEAATRQAQAALEQAVVSLRI